MFVVSVQLWLQCQQLLAIADQRLGDTVSEISSTYFLSNVNAVPQPPAAAFSSSSCRSFQRLTTCAASSSDASRPSPEWDVTQCAVPDGAAGEFSKSAKPPGACVSGGGEGGSKAVQADAEGNTPALVPPEVYLKRFVALARQRDGTAGDTFPDQSVDVSPADVRQPQPAPPGSPLVGQGEGEASPCSTSTPWQRPEREEEPPALTRSPTSTSWVGPEVPEILRRQGQLHISAAPNIYCWAALKPVVSRRVCQEEGSNRRRPALPLASFPQVTGQSKSL